MRRPLFLDDFYGAVGGIDTRVCLPGQAVHFLQEFFGEFLAGRVVGMLPDLFPGLAGFEEGLPMIFQTRGLAGFLLMLASRLVSRTG